MARQHYEGKKHKRNAARARLLEQLAGSLDAAESAGQSGGLEQAVSLAMAAGAWPVPVEPVEPVALAAAFWEILLECSVSRQQPPCAFGARLTPTKKTPAADLQDSV